MSTICNKLGALAHMCNPSYLGGWDQEDLGFKANQGKQFKRSPHLQNNQSKMDLRWDSSDRVPALQVWSPEFKPNPTKKKKKSGTSKEKSEIKILSEGKEIHDFTKEFYQTLKEVNTNPSQTLTKQIFKWGTFSNIPEFHSILKGLYTIPNWHLCYGLHILPGYENQTPIDQTGGNHMVISIGTKVDTDQFNTLL
jgi:hypothetical protein